MKSNIKRAPKLPIDFWGKFLDQYGPKTDYKFPMELKKLSRKAKRMYAPILKEHPELAISAAGIKHYADLVVVLNTVLYDSIERNQSDLAYALFNLFRHIHVQVTENISVISKRFKCVKA